MPGYDEAFQNRDREGAVLDPRSLKNRLLARGSVQTTCHSEAAADTVWLTRSGRFRYAVQVRIGAEGCNGVCESANRRFTHDR